MATTESQVSSMQLVRDTCPSCSSAMRPFVEFSDVPVNSCILMESREEALSYPRGEIVLGFCDSCGFVCNLAFDSELAEYSSRYEETQAYSPTFREFHRRLTLDLIERHDIHSKDVLEIGCGKGEFLALICELGGNRGLGFDPGFDDRRETLDGVPDARVVRDFYSDKYADHDADFVCCKMTLEHIAETAEFVRISRLAMRPDGVICFMVPEATRILQDCAFEDIYYEHCSYFTPGSLGRLFHSQGLEVTRVGTEYAGQYLTIEARRRRSDDDSAYPDEDVPEFRQLVDSFPARCEEKLQSWRNILTEAASRGPVALWGSGSKAVAFLGAVDDSGQVDFVVDINPNRQGHFMPGSGQAIVAPADLMSRKPGTVIVMNPVYEPEIRGELEAMGLDPVVHSL